MDMISQMIATLAVIALLAVGCGDRRDSGVVPVPADQINSAVNAGLPPGDHTLQLDHDGRSRSYIVHVPANVDMPAAVVIALHGGGGTGRGFQDQNGLDRVADREGFVAVYPEGTGLLANRLHTWNSGASCCGYAFDRDVDDVGFLRAMIADLEGVTEINTGRVYMTGHSNGAMMAYRFATEAPELVAAIVPVGGALDVELVEPTGAIVPVAMLHIHSLDDPRAIYEGGDGPPFPGTQRTVPHEPVREGIEEWAASIGCDDDPRVEAPQAGDSSNDGQTRQRIVWSDCAFGTRVEHLVLTGSGHGWPGVEVSRAIQRILGPSTTVIDASEEVWAFASQFERPRGG